MNYSNPTDLTILRMVYNRLPFLAQTSPNQTVIGDFVLEVMWELNHCFKIADADIGDDDNYNIEQRAIIADVVAVYILLLTSLANVQGVNGQASTTGTKFLKRAKGGDAEVEWGELDIKKSGGLIMAGQDYMNKYYQSALRRGRNIGCIIDICIDCAGLPAQQVSSMPLMFVKDCGCGC